MAKRVRIITIIVLALVLRLVGINQSFWLDEASQGQMSSFTVETIWNDRPGDFHPPLFYLLAHFWQELGSSEVWLRMLPITFGLLNILVVYKWANNLWPDKKINLGKRFSFSAAEVAAFLLAINPFHVYYSQEYRSYSLLALLGTFSMYLFKLGNNWMSLVNALMLYTHYSGILLIAAQFFYSIVFAREKVKWFFFNLLLSFVIVVPWIPQFIKQFQSGSGIDSTLPGWREVLTVPTLKAIPLIFFKFVAGRINILPKLAYGIYIGFVLGVTAFSVLIAKSFRSLLLTWVMLPIIASIFLSFLVPQTQPFRLIFALPALILFFTQAVIKYPKLILTVMIYISVVGNVMYFTRPRLQREQWREAISFLNTTNGSIVVKSSDKFSPFIWYDNDLPVIGAVPSFPARHLEVSGVLSSSFLKDSVYMLEYLTDLTDPGHVVEKSLIELGYKSKEAYNFEGVGIIWHYQKL